ncbi:MAG: Cytochrome B561 [Rhodanobacteraceae bacterium]|jgi:cytochrome b561|nr:MAG: Cytochrome B561 [Rhodanobacteraceae bacterium]
MPLRSTEAGWGALVRAFHWSIALLILVQAVIGLTMTDMALSPAKLRVFALHKSIGMTILALVLLRIAWRLSERRPADPPAMPRWQVRAARAMHLALYVLILAIPLSGWWFNSASNAPLVWFGLIDIPSLTGGYDPVWKPRALLVHQTLFWLLVVLLVGHVGAALWHHFRQRDDVLRKMVVGVRGKNGGG